MTKTATFAAMHFTVAFGVAWALTGDVVVGGAVALVEPAVNTVAFHFHERAWNRFGRRAVAGAHGGGVTSTSATKRPCTRHKGERVSENCALYLA
jgi:uncharacterized membrane protein